MRQAIGQGVSSVHSSVLKMLGLVSPTPTPSERPLPTSAHTWMEAQRVGEMSRGRGQSGGAGLGEGSQEGVGRLGNYPLALWLILANRCLGFPLPS